MNKKDLKIEYMRGKGPGGQHKNKTDSAVRITHIPTGISVTIDGRNQHGNKRKALRTLKQKLKDREAEIRSRRKKKIRDQKIHDRTVVRTYDFKRQMVKDHRTGKEAPLKQVLEKGRIDLLRPDEDDDVE